MTFIEHIASRDDRVIEPAEGSLRHDQRVVGDDNPRLSCLSDVLLDKAAAKMRAGRVHAFAAPIGEPVDPAASDQLGKPAWEVSRGQVSCLARGDPARDQSEMPGGSSRAADCRADRLLVVQQTEEIFTSLADYDPAALDLGIGVEAVKLAGDLSLQIAGVGRDPNRAAVFLRPQACRGDISERLSDAGACFGKN